MSEQGMRLPDVYIIGTQKSGTTAIFDWIAQHPEVYGNPAEKDFPFFSDENIYARGVEPFMRFFRKASQRAIVLGGDANVMYVAAAAERLHRHLPDARLIAILRDPVERAYSAWRYAIERQLEMRSFEEAVKDEMNGLGYSEVYEKRQKDYLEHGRYGAQLKQFLQWYPRQNIKVVLYEDLREEPISVMQQLFRFMGVDPSFQPVLAKKNETRGGARFRWLSKFLYRDRPASTPGWRMMRRIIPAGCRASIREWLVSFNRVYHPSPPIPDKIRSILREYYSEETVYVEKLLDRRLDAWRC